MHERFGCSNIDVILWDFIYYSLQEGSVFWSFLEVKQ